MALHHYVAQDRLRALGRGIDLPERAHGAALFADISGFTALTEALRREEGERRGIESLSQRVNTVYDALIEAVEAHSGSVVGFAGDAITCWFDDLDGPASARAAHAALGMQAAMAHFSDLPVKVAVASGPARRFTVGDPDIQLIDALAGATLTRVALGESLAQAGEVLVDEATAQALALRRTFPRRGPQGEQFFALTTDALPSPLQPVRRTHETSIPGLDTLRPWLLPFLIDREAQGHSLFATDLRPATAIFARLTGLDYDNDEGAAALLADLVSRVQRVLRRHGGVLLELNIGDKGTYLYGCFGAAQVHEDDPARAVRAALSGRRALQGQPIQVQVGLSCGTMRVGGYGGHTRQSFGAIGDEVNSAARLMVLAQPGEILISGRVHQCLGPEFTLEPRLPIPIKGKAEPMPVYAVLRAQQRRAIRLQEPISSTPLAGREAEMALLADGVAAAARRRGRLIGLAADAGMGKSRLVAEGVKLALSSGFVGYGGSCRMDGIGTPYLVWKSIWAAFFDIDPGLPTRRQIRQIEAELVRLVPQHAEAWPLLGSVLGLNWPDNDFTAALEPKDRKALLETVLLECMGAAAREAAEDGMALLVVLEDLHAADPLSLDLLARVAQSIEDLPVLMLLSFRPGEAALTNPRLLALAAHWQALPHYAQIEPVALTAPQVEQIIRTRMAVLFPERHGAIPSGLIERITERAQGNPFYVEEFLNYLHDRGIDMRDPGAAASLDLPTSLHSLVLSRTDQLAVQQQLTLKAASIIGRLFHDADLTSYCPELGGAAQVKAALDELDRMGLTPKEPSEPESSHLFVHRVTQEVAYENIAYAARKELHGRFALYLEQRHGPDAPLLAPVLAHHFERSGLDPQAAHYLSLAGEQAATRYANEEALDLFQRAMKRLPPEATAVRMGLMLRSEAILALQGRHEERRQCLSQLEALAAALPSPLEALEGQAQVAVRRARLEVDTGHYPAARQHAQAAIQALEPLSPWSTTQAERLVDALHQEARAALQSGHGLAARPQLDRALALAREHQYRRGETHVLSLLGLVLWQGGDLKAADAVLGEALLLVQDIGDLRRQLSIRNNLGVVSKTRGRHNQALGHYEAALALARRIGDRSGIAMLLNNMGDVCLEQGNFPLAARHSAEAARLYHELGEAVSHGSALINRAEAYRNLGQYGAAREVALQAQRLSRAGQHPRGDAIVTDNLGLIAFGECDFDTAVAHAREALALARAIEAPVLEAGILRNLGRALTASCRFEEAAETLELAAMRAASLDTESLSLEVNAARAEWQLARGGHDATAQALALLSPSLVALTCESPASKQPTMPPWVPLWAALTAVRALQAGNDPRADAMLEAARRELHRRCDFITGEAARQSFLQVAEHRALWSTNV